MTHDIITYLWFTGFFSSFLPLGDAIALSLPTVTKSERLKFDTRTTELELWMTLTYPEESPAPKPRKGRKYWKVQKNGRWYRLYEDGSTVLTNVFPSKGSQVAPTTERFSDVPRTVDSYPGPYRYPNQQH